MKTLRYPFLLLLPLWLMACNLTQEVDLELPEYDPQVVVECYLQPGQPYLLTLVESTGYFEDVELNYVRDAIVTITHEGQTDTLQPLEFRFDDPLLGLLIDTAQLGILRPILGDGLYFYGSFTPVPTDYNSDFALKVRLTDGRELSSVTQILPPVPIDTVEWRFDEDSLAFSLTKVQDNPNQANYYRRLLQRRERRISQDGQDTTWVSDVEQDFTLDDEFSNGELLTFGTPFVYRYQDTLINTLYHITADYYRFITTRDAAITASFSPFGQPAVVYSNIEGGMGIFTGISFDRKVTVIGE
ncbi:MAG: DUF4249 domain-containing protein [Bacteroidetes bacterium]|nr:MAG: DUF4249 domain-containing protein [Bacteroidota bacterium]